MSQGVQVSASCRLLAEVSFLRLINSEPLTVENGEPIAHLRMDAVSCEFLLADD